MTFYESNMKCVKRNREIIFQEINNHISNTNSQGIKVKSIETRDGNSTILVEKDNQKYRLNSVYSPVYEAKKWVEQYEFRNLKIVVTLFGLGNGIFLREIIKKISEQDRIIVYEPSVNVFLHVLNNYDMQDILSNEKISIIVDGVNNQELTYLLNEYVDWTNMNSQISLVHPQYDKLYKKKYMEFLGAIENHNTTQVVNRNTAAFLGEAVTKNTIHNIGHIRNSNITSDLLDRFPPEVPAIIVGAGPSLDNNIEELKRAKGKAIIFATDTSLKYLFAHNIIPDFVVTLDALKSGAHFQDERWKSIPLLCSIESNPTILDMHQGKKIFYNTGNYLKSFYDTLEKRQLHYSTGGSVATACFSICTNLGFKKIILIGQDLAYKGDYTHAGDVVLNARQTGQKTLMVEDINGNMIKTRYDWYSYIMWFNNAISICKEFDVDVIDATEGGAKLDNAIIMTLAEAISEFCTISIDFKETYKNVRPTFSDDEMNLLKKHLNKSIDELVNIEKKATKANEICDKLIVAVKKNQLENHSNQSLVKEIAKINDFIQNKPVYYLIDDYILGASTAQLGEMNQLTDDVQTNQLNTYNRAKVIYKVVQEATRKLKPLFDEVISRI